MSNSEQKVKVRRADADCKTDIIIVMLIIITIIILTCSFSALTPISASACAISLYVIKPVLSMSILWKAARRVDTSAAPRADATMRRAPFLNLLLQE